uniref:Dimethylargininase n=1 Tax=Thelazia callipaeda TaxID=103827 RepID=A0A0N5CTC0_THECL
LQAGVDIIELSPEEGCLQQSLFTGDAAICINGTALITRPSKRGCRFSEISSLLGQLSWQVVETPASEHGKDVVLEGSDVLYTGREIFVGVRKNGTNMEGALVVGRTFSDLAVIPISLAGSQPLRHYISFVSNDVLSVCNCKEAKLIVQRMEREATFRYKTLTVEHDEAGNCLSVNDSVIYRQDVPETKFQVLQERVQLMGIIASELSKIGKPISRFILLTAKINTLKSLW